MISPKKRFEILKRDNFRCQYCGKTGKDVTLEIDHITPKSKGGTDDFDNLITCCRECNMGKSDDFIGENINIGKIKLAEQESKTMKWFFETWNSLHYGTLDKKNISFMSGFVKLFYADFNKRYLLTKISNGEITQFEFEEGGDKCCSIINEFDQCIRDDIGYIIANLESNNPDYDGGWTRYTDDYNERLNWLITYQMVRLGYPKPFIYKYSLCPNKIQEWENEKWEEIGF